MEGAVGYVCYVWVILYISVDSSLTEVHERDRRERHMKGESIELEAHIPLGTRSVLSFTVIRMFLDSTII
jgi:hypothetical protein